MSSRSAITACVSWSRSRRTVSTASKHSVRVRYGVQDQSEMMSELLVVCCLVVSFIGSFVSRNANCSRETEDHAHRISASRSPDTVHFDLADRFAVSVRECDAPSLSDEHDEVPAARRCFSSAGTLLSSRSVIARDTVRVMRTRLDLVAGVVCHVSHSPPVGFGHRRETQHDRSSRRYFSLSATL